MGADDTREQLDAARGYAAIIEQENRRLEADIARAERGRNDARAVLRDMIEASQAIRDRRDEDLAIGWDRAITAAGAQIRRPDSVIPADTLEALAIDLEHALLNNGNPYRKAPTS